MNTEPNFFSDRMRHTYDSLHTKRGRRLCTCCGKAEPQGKPVRKKSPVKTWLRLKEALQMTIQRNPELKIVLVIMLTLIAWVIVLEACT